MPSPDRIGPSWLHTMKCPSIHFDSMRRNGLPMFHTSHIENSTVPEDQC
jgi:hypothetical protein